MIELFYWPTPNGHKITIFLEETGLPYEIKPIDITAGDQFKPDFLAISPNNRMPAIIDHAPDDGGSPISVFESGAILTYLAEKTGQFLPRDVRARKVVSEWLFWQIGGLGPMAGQAGHFKSYAPEKLPYAIQRYENEVNRLYGVMDRRLAGRDYLADSYSIADMATYPWVVPFGRYGQSLEGFANLRRWFETMKDRPAVQQAYEKGEPWMRRGTVTDQGRSILFGQNDDKIRGLTAAKI
jgi:GST-like protein